MKKAFSLSRIFTLAWCAAALLTACGGGGDSGSAAATPTGGNALPPARSPTIPSPTPISGAQPIASATMTLQLGTSATPAAGTSGNFQPAFHVLPVLLDTPDDQDGRNNRASAHRAPQRITIPTENAGLSTRHLTVQDIRSRRSHQDPAEAGRTFAPMLAPAAATVYTPAQIRAAYGLPPLPALGSTPTAAQAASMGAGQTIYILGASHNANVAAELAAFNTKFSLPTCTTDNIPVNSPLPLAPASSTNPRCTLSMVFATSNGAMTSTPPAASANDAHWTMETAIDVQWAHATAPLARIVVIEASGDILGTIPLANAMGPGVVSMSWGTNESSMATRWESYFTGGVGMTYLAATGDNGAGVSWPAASPHVLAVGGTTLSYSGSGPRSETAWTGSGGGISAYLPTPAYQKLSVAGLGQVNHRSVADVSFNADPSTGQYIALINPGETNVNWLAVGGTSIATPEWAGIVAIANAMRAATGKARLGEPHNKLYAMAATAPDTYANVFGDITSGANGSCAICAARSGYDQPTGLGTPNVTAMLDFLSDASAPLEVTPASITATTGSALSFTVSVNTSNPLTYTLSGAPAGLTIDASGVVKWTTPVAGSYDLTVTATDAQTKAQGIGVYTISVVAPTAPTVSASTVYGMPGSVLSFQIIYGAGALEPLTFSLSGAPSGMAISSTGTVTWAKPVLGTYNVNAVVKNSKTGLSGSATYTVKVQSTAPPTSYPEIVFTPLQALAGKAVSGSISFTDPGATSLTVTLSGAPIGVHFFVRDMSLLASWAKPVTGSYAIRVNTLDNAGRRSTATVPLVVTAQ